MSAAVACPCGGRKRNGVCDRCGPSRARQRRDYDRQRGSSTERGYDYRWQRFRKLYLAMYPLCCDCMEHGVVTAATDIHHKAKLREYPELKYDNDNLMALCGKHHDARTARGE